ncbi:hypothetical protein WNZ15_26010 [Roseibium sp. AS2]|uniref:hypothetical protein n=1 Tax=Roseibium sp. AS2 TaxID=3135781 RepID=UPI003180226A
MTYLKGDDRIIVCSNYQFVDTEFYQENVWNIARLTHELMPSRAAWLTGMTIIYDYAHHLYFRDGSKYWPSDIGKIFPDPQNRWFSDFLKADETGEAPLSYTKYYERLRMIELYCRLRHIKELPASEHWEGAA